MKRFKVTFVETVYHDLYVNAENEDAANEIAKQHWADGTYCEQGETEGAEICETVEADNVR